MSESILTEIERQEIGKPLPESQGTIQIEDFAPGRCGKQVFGQVQRSEMFETIRQCKLDDLIPAKMENGQALELPQR